MSNFAFPLTTSQLATALGCSSSQIRNIKARAGLIERTHFVKQPLAIGGSYALAFTLEGCIAIAQRVGTPQALQFAQQFQQQPRPGAIVPTTPADAVPTTPADVVPLDYGRLQRYFQPLATAQSEPSWEVEPIPARGKAVIRIQDDGLSVETDGADLVLDLSPSALAEVGRSPSLAKHIHYHQHERNGALEAILGLIAIILIAIVGLVTLAWIAESLNSRHSQEIASHD